MTPALTFVQGIAATSSLVPGTALEDVERADTLRRAEAGAAHARRAGFDAEARGLGSLRVPSRGSVSDDVATHARRSVLIAPAPHAKGAV